MIFKPLQRATHHQLWRTCRAYMLGIYTHQGVQETPTASGQQLTTPQDKAGSAKAGLVSRAAARVVWQRILGPGMCGSPATLAPYTSSHFASQTT